MRTLFSCFTAFTALLASAVFSTLATAGGPEGLAATVVVVNQASDTVTLIDLVEMEAYRHVAEVGGPHEVTVSADGKRAVVTNYRKRSGSPQKTLSLISLPDGVSWSPVQR